LQLQIVRGHNSYFPCLTYKAGKALKFGFHIQTPSGFHKFDTAENNQFFAGLLFAYIPDSIDYLKGVF